MSLYKFLFEKLKESSLWELITEHYYTQNQTISREIILGNLKDFDGYYWSMNENITQDDILEFCKFKGLVKREENENPRETLYLNWQGISVNGNFTPDFIRKYNLYAHVNIAKYCSNPLFTFPFLLEILKSRGIQEKQLNFLLGATNESDFVHDRIWWLFDWYSLSKRVSLEFILKFPYIPWIIKMVFRNKDITLEKVKEILRMRNREYPNLSHEERDSLFEFLPWEDIKLLSKDIKINYKTLSKNRNLSLDLILENEILFTNIDWKIVSANPAVVDEKTLETHSHLPFNEKHFATFNCYSSMKNLKKFQLENDFLHNLLHDNLFAYDPWFIDERYKKRLAEKITGVVKEELLEISMNPSRVINCLDEEEKSRWGF